MTCSRVRGPWAGLWNVGMTPSDIVIINPAPDQDDKLSKIYLPAAGLTPDDVTVLRPGDPIPTDTKLIIAMGETATQLGCPGNVSAWRGYIIPGSQPPVYVVLDPAMLFDS